MPNKRYFKSFSTHNPPWKTRTLWDCGRRDRILFSLHFSVQHSRACEWMYDVFYHQIITFFSSPLWLRWCYRPVLTDPSSSGQSQLSTVYHHPNHRHKYCLGFMIIEVQGFAATRFDVARERRKMSYWKKKLYIVKSADRNQVKWRGCCWYWKRGNSSAVKAQMI